MGTTGTPVSSPLMAGIDQLVRGAVKVLPEGALEQKLALGRPLRVKFGIDPTARDIHIGNAIALQRMRAFQEQGHTGVLIIGDYTARVGDPSGRSQERKILTDEQIDGNARAYFEQASRILDPERTELRFNSEWLGQLDFAALLAPDPHDDGVADARAKRLREALQGPSADLDLRVPVPVDAGL